MNLQGRDLREGLAGTDVGVLHGELAMLGYTVPISDQTLHFGPGTREAVVQFQTDHGLRPTGIVDAATAVALSAAILVNAPRLVVLEPPEHAGEVLVLSRPEMVIGQSDPADLIVEHRSVDRRHALIRVDPTRQVTIQDLTSTGGTFVNEESPEWPKVLQQGDLVRISELVARFETARSPQAPPSPAHATTSLSAISTNPGPPAEEDKPAAVPVGGLPQAANVDQPLAATRTGAGLIKDAPALTGDGQGEQPVAAVADSAANAFSLTVTGTVMSPALPRVGVLNVRLVDKNVGGDQVLAETQTNDDGTYAFRQVVISPAYLTEHSKTQPDLQVRVFAGDQFLAASAVRYSAPVEVSLDVVLPTGTPGLPSEYETLTRALAAVYQGKLGDLQEDANRQDITYLANKTGWDARAVALAALADQFSQIATPAPAVGTATNEARAGAVPTVSLQSAFYYALFRAGLPANADGLFRASPVTAQAIWQQAIAQGVIPDNLASDVPSAVQTFLALSAAYSLTAPPPVGVSTMQEMLQPVLPETAQQEQFAQLHAQHQGDWVRFWPAVEQELGTEPAQQLQLMGQLYYLTVNNQPLMAALLAAEGTNLLISTDGLASLASRGYYQPASWTPLIKGTIPPGIPGANAAEQASNYAELLAAQVRIAFPTAVVADQISRGILPIPGATRTAADVASFLTNHRDFEIGAEPVEGYLSRTGVTDAPENVIPHIKRIQRVYQLTPDDNSMAVLLRHNLDSAFAITRYDSVGFVRAFQDKLGGNGTAAAIHARAKQVFASVLSTTVAYLGGRVAPRLGGVTPVLSGFPPQASAPAYPVIAYPTLESLFGSLDYCDCPDCGSIMSPAAYLTDLLHYLDQPATSASFQIPQDVLFQRRPDLQYLPLTCANTNTALPYIDVVNEICEYFVANGLMLDGYQGHDTGDTVTSDELMAIPQYVNDAAYEVLRGAFFPPPLPFNRPLMLLRLHLQNLGIALPDAMAALRADDRLVNRDTPTSYGWSDILVEQLGISRDEYRLFTDSSLQLGDLYGLPNATALATLQTMSVQELCRRLGISYDDLAAIVQTQYINPNAALIPRLIRLNAPFAGLKGLTASSLPAGLDATEYGGVSPTDDSAVITWIATAWPLITDIITISIPDGGPGDCSGANMQLRYSNPDNNNNLLSGTDFFKLIRFIRLWQKLAPLVGNPDDATSIQLTDNILAALGPAADEAGFAALLSRLGFLMQVMNRLSLSTDAVAQLLACWAPIGTVGLNSLYQSMFLTPAMLELDPGTQTTTVSPTINVGDVLHTRINGVEVDAYTVRSGQKAPDVAAAIAAEIDTATVPDPVSQRPVDSLFFASSKANVITIKKGFTLACQSSDASLSYTAATQSPITQTATLAGTVTAGAMLKTIINTVTIPYTAAATDTDLATLAASIAGAINATTVLDPYSGLPLNDLVAASSAGAVVTIIAANAGAPFTLQCSLDSANAGTYTATPNNPSPYVGTILQGVPTAGDTLTTTISTSGDVKVNPVNVSYTVRPSDTDLATLGASIAAAISTDAQQDPTTQLPLGHVVKAASASASSSINYITITANDPATPLAVACTVSTNAANATESYAFLGNYPQNAYASVAGVIPEGATLTTTINTVTLAYTAVAGDTPDTIAADITAAISACTLIDAATNQPLNSLVTAARESAPGALLITANDLTSLFTLTCSMSPAWYVAGRQNPPFADDGYGDFLADPNQKVFGHQPTLCAAFHLTGAEFDLIAAALKFDATTPLTLPDISAVFRYGWLAHTLGLSVLEFLQLREFSGLDPFLPLDPGTSPAEPPAIQFLRLWAALTTAGLTTAQALYLIWNQDISGTFTPSLPVVTGLASTLRASFAAVDAQFTLQDDPDGSIAQGLMTLVYGSAASTFFFGLLNQSFTTSVPYASASGQLPAPVIAASNAQLSYDDLREQLTFAGVLDPAALTAISGAITVNTTDNTQISAGPAVFTPASMANIAAGSVLVIDTGAAQETVTVTKTSANTFNAVAAKPHDGTQAPFPIVNDPFLPAAVANLAAASQQAVSPFFTTYPELGPLYAAYASSADPVPERRTALLDGFLPILKQKRKQQQALATVTAAAGTDPSFANTLMQNPAILHADADPTAAAATDLTATGQQGLSAQFFLDNNPAATPDQETACVPALLYAQTATLGGKPTTSDVLTTTINGVVIAYTAGAADATLADLAGNIAAHINQTTTQDPSANRPLNRAYLASATGRVITITGLDSSGATSYFSLSCSVSTGGTETYTAGSQLPAGPGGASIAASWNGYLGVPQDGSYDICIATDPGAEIALQVNGNTVLGTQVGSLWRSQTLIPLLAAQLAPITLTVTSIKTTLSVSWQSPGLGWQAIPSQYLCPLGPVRQLGNTYVRFLMATTLSSALSLTAAEIAYLGTTTSFAVDTTSSSKTAAGTATFTPASMANIAPNSVLVIDSGSAQETVTVATCTKTTFTAVTANAHDGTATPFPIVSRSYPQTGRGWLNFLDTAEAADLATAASLTAVLTDLLDFAFLKHALSPSDERLLTVLQSPVGTLPNNQSALLSLTGWSQASVNALLTQFFGNTDLASLSAVGTFRRVYDAYQIVQSCRLTASTVIASITNAPSASTVGALESALRTLYAARDWLTVIRPINDAARVQQRDALVAYTLQQLHDQYSQPLVSLSLSSDAATGATVLNCTTSPNASTVGMLVQAAWIAPGTVVTQVTGEAITISQGTLATLSSGSTVVLAPQDAVAFENPDSLFEYFLVDTQTQPPVETSRIRLALSTVQLFTERVLRNLEPQVSPGDVDPSRWEWMKRYRVWQANREVFLWPENWLYPELRDDQSPFFQQMMSSLLQGDTTDDAAVNAYLDYLTSLEQVAKLEPCGMYYQPATTDTDETSYVVARTAGAHRKHYFRQLQAGSWTPWTEVKIDCEDMPITPIVWNSRLFLFWLKAVKQAQPPQAQLTSTGSSGNSTPLANLQVSDLNTSMNNAATAASKRSIVVQAVLCWTEFYNGKWQPTKTSDVNLPTTVGTFDAAGDNSFDAVRNRLRIVPATCTGTNPQFEFNEPIAGFKLTPPVSSDTLLLVITATGSPYSISSGGFILHNTHSLPVRFDGINVEVLIDYDGSGRYYPAWYPLPEVLDVPSPSRSLQPASWPLSPYTGAPASGTFTVSYQESPNGPVQYSNNILQYNWQPRFVEAQPGLRDAWDSPIIYEDARHVFYVITTESQPLVQDYRGFGALTQLPGGSTLPARILPLVLRRPGITQTRFADTQSTNFAGADHGAVQDYLGQGTNINASLGSAMRIPYQGQVIFPAGSAIGLNQADGRSRSE
ncbi:MAG TPA: neuraminidase-like domain-containing protein [Streptosporangiaceae bacterium]